MHISKTNSYKLYKFELFLVCIEMRLWNICRIVKYQIAQNEPIENVLRRLESVCWNGAKKSEINSMRIFVWFFSFFLKCCVQLSFFCCCYYLEQLKINHMLSILLAQTDKDDKICAWNGWSSCGQAINISKRTGVRVIVRLSIEKYLVLELKSSIKLN